jgi:hypothetical protein
MSKLWGFRFQKTLHPLRLAGIFLKLHPADKTVPGAKLDL